MDNTGFTGPTTTFLGAPEDFEGMDLTGKIVLIARGSLSFFEKHVNAVQAGAAAVLVYNNTTGIINMDLSSTTVNNPCAFLQIEDAMKLFAGIDREAEGPGAARSRPSWATIPTARASTR